MNCYTREQIEAAMAKKGYKYFKGDNYDVNIQVLEIQKQEIELLIDLMIV